MDNKTKTSVRSIGINICAVTALSFGVSVLSAHAEPPSENRGMFGNSMADSKSEIQQTARDASAVYSKFTNGEGSRITKAQIDKAKCVAIFPNLTNVALVVGGRHGDGVVTCRTANGFSSVAPLDLSSASIGAQLGANRTDLILLLNSDSAKQRLEKGTITLGADVTVSASSSDRKVMDVGVSTENSDVVAFAEDRGLFAGAALNGTTVSIDKDEIKNLYGKDLSIDGILTSANDNNMTGAASDLVKAISK